MTKRKRTHNELQNTTRKTKDRATRTPLMPVMKLLKGNFCFTSDTHRVALVTNPVIRLNAYDKWNILVVICYTDFL